MKSTDDTRVGNNVMRHEYRMLTEREKENMQKVKDMALVLYDKISFLGQSRELSLAKTKLEESVMWAVKHITG